MQDLFFNKQFQNFCDSIGLSISDVIKRAQIIDSLENEELVVTMSESYRILKAFEQLINDKQLIQISDVKNTSKFFAPLFAAQIAPNGLEALKRFEKYECLTDPITLIIRERGNKVMIHVSYLDDDYSIPRFELLHAQLLIISLLRLGNNKFSIPEKVSGNVKYGTLISKWIGVNPIKSNSNLIVLKRNDLICPFETRMDGIWVFIKPELDRRLKKMKPNYNFSNTIRNKIMIGLSSNLYSLTDIANSLMISKRTLQRKLIAEGTTFAKVLEEARIIMVKKYVNDEKYSLCEIAKLVGYQNTETLSKSFKRWTGQSITNYRKNGDILK